MSTLTQARVQSIPADVRFGIMDLYAAYTAALDEGRYRDWADCFTTNAEYRLTTKENHERGLPIGIIYCDGKGMIEDRAFTTAETTIAQPRALRHIVSGMSIRSYSEGYRVGADFSDPPDHARPYEGSRHVGALYRPHRERRRAIPVREPRVRDGYAALSDFGGRAGLM